MRRYKKMVPTTHTHMDNVQIFNKNNQSEWLITCHVIILIIPAECEIAASQLTNWLTK